MSKKYCTFLFSDSQYQFWQDFLAIQLNKYIFEYLNTYFYLVFQIT